MALEKHGTGAYAPMQAMAAILARQRERGLPTPIDADGLVRAGLTTESLAPRTIQSMKLLDWIDDDGELTPAFAELERVPTDGYHDRLGDLLRAAYADVLTYVDPEQDDPDRIADAFRYYDPPSMRPRMFSLFAGLMEYANAIPDGHLTGQKRTSGTSSRSTSSNGASSSRPRRTRRTTSNDDESKQKRDEQKQQADPGRKNVSLPPAITGFVNALPTEGTTMTKSQHDRFVTAFTAVLAISYEIHEEDDDAAAER